MSLVNLIELPSLGDDRGSLVSIEMRKHIPFDVQRVYYIFATKDGVSRGFHAHKQLKQFAICVSGRCRITLDNGVDKQTVWLDSPFKGLVITGMVWREMHDFSDDCVLLVLASEHYDESDYIRNYQEFMEAVL